MSNHPSIASLFPAARKIRFDTGEQINLLSQMHHSHDSRSKSNELLSTVKLSLDELSRRIGMLRSLVNNEAPQSREIWTVKIEQLSEDFNMMMGQVANIETRIMQSVNYHLERNELFGGDLRQRENLSAMGELVEEGASTDRSNRMVGEILNTGAATLDSLIGQRDRLKSVRRMVLDMGTLLGLSDTTMRHIERRDIVDRYIVIFLMCLTLMILFWLYW